MSGLENIRKLWNNSPTVSKWISLWRTHDNCKLQDKFCYDTCIILICMTYIFVFLAYYNLSWHAYIRWFLILRSHHSYESFMVKLNLVILGCTDRYPYFFYMTLFYNLALHEVWYFSPFHFSFKTTNKKHFEINKTRTKLTTPFPLNMKWGYMYVHPK